ncbi:MAG: hypothetical protein MUC88_13990 [Planctomycetes bacterium]|jgi:hypothetical protein|nr:hypothetical protein [Planctomycetota bacterium]
MNGRGGHSEPTWHTTEVVETWEEIEARHKGFSCLPIGPEFYWMFRGDR